MKRVYVVCLFLLLTTTFLLSQSNPVPLINPSARVVSPIGVSQADPKVQARILDQYGKLPLSFEANVGQLDPKVKFASRGGSNSLYLNTSEAVLILNKVLDSESRLQTEQAGPSTKSSPFSPARSKFDRVR